MNKFLNCGRQEVCRQCLPFDTEQRLSICFVVRLVVIDGDDIPLETHAETRKRVRALLEVAEGEEFIPELITAAAESAEELIFNE
ncbi:MAG: hypothetical protein M3Q36_03025 [bacterium]|nr:hypothetical protein [bacterium]